MDSSGQFISKYISPERGGTLVYDPGVDQAIFQDQNWMVNDRRKNRTEQFRQQSAAQFRNLEVMVLREIEKDISKRANNEYTFDSTINEINRLLPKISLKRSDRGFEIADKNKKIVSENNISSGESELISLSIEVLVFARSDQNNRLLLLDEPDVHLHPDLQQKFVEFVEKAAIEFDFKVALATHSTAIVGAFSESADLQIVPISDRIQSDFSSFSYDPICHEILPIFGSHPLSSHFNRTPILLVEGDDDKRVFEQIMRTSQGRIKYSPCVVGTVSEMSKWESWLNDYLPSIYDDPKGYSVRDLDGSDQTEIEDVGCVTRARLNCYAIENLLLTTECLQLYDYTSEGFCNKISEWIGLNPSHQTTDALIALRDNFEERRTMKIKDLRNIILALLGTTKPWEVLVGQIIVNNRGAGSTDPHSLDNYLGQNVINKLLC